MLGSYTKIIERSVYNSRQVLKSEKKACIDGKTRIR